MKTMKIFKMLVNYAVIFSFASCTTTQEIVRRSELKERGAFDEISVTANNGSTYTLNNYSLRDSTIFGVGIVNTGVKSGKFMGEIKLRDIKKIEGISTGTAKGIVAAGLITAFAITFIAFAGAEGKTFNEIKITYPSCNNLSGLEENSAGLMSAGGKGLLFCLNKGKFNCIKNVFLKRRNDVVCVSIQGDEVSMNITKSVAAGHIVSDDENVFIDIENDDPEKLIEKYTGL